PRAPATMMTEIVERRLWVINNVSLLENRLNVRRAEVLADHRTTESEVHQVSGKPVRKPVNGRSGLLCLLDCLYDRAKGSIPAQILYSNFEDSCLVERTGENSAARKLVLGQRLSRDRSFFHAGVAGKNAAVNIQALDLHRP